MQSNFHIVATSLVEGAGLGSGLGEHLEVLKPVAVSELYCEARLDGESVSEMMAKGLVSGSSGEVKVCTGPTIFHSCLSE